MRWLLKCCVGEILSVVLNSSVGVAFPICFMLFSLHDGNSQTFDRVELPLHMLKPLYCSLLFAGCWISWIPFYFFLQSLASSFFQSFSEGWEDYLFFSMFQHWLLPYLLMTFYRIVGKEDFSLNKVTGKSPKFASITCGSFQNRYLFCIQSTGMPSMQ